MDQLPSDLVDQIFAYIDHPYYWINTMSTCKHLRGIIYPMYLAKDFRVMIMTGNDSAHSCNHVPNQTTLILDPELIDYHFMYTFSIKLYHVPGLYLPFMRSGYNADLYIDPTEMLVHYTFKFPNYMQNPIISKTIQEISLRKFKYTDIEYDYYERLSLEINKYYSKHTELIGESKHKHDIIYLKKLKERSTKNLIEEDRLGLKYFYIQNKGNICLLCGQSHLTYDHYGRSWDQNYNFDPQNNILVGSVSSYGNCITIGSLDTLMNRTLAFGNNTLTGDYVLNITFAVGNNAFSGVYVTNDSHKCPSYYPYNRQ